MLRIPGCLPAFFFSFSPPPPLPLMLIPFCFSSLSDLLFRFGVRFLVCVVDVLQFPFIRLCDWSSNFPLPLFFEGLLPSKSSFPPSQKAQGGRSQNLNSSARFLYTWQLFSRPSVPSPLSGLVLSCLSPILPECSFYS